MSTSSTVVRRAYAEAETFVRLGVRGHEEHDSTQIAFMAMRHAAPGTEHTAASSSAALRQIHELVARVPLAPALRRVYQLIEHPYCEYVFGQWIMMSLSKVCERYELLRDVHGQARAIDFAFAYAGMGYCTVCSYDPVSDHIYYRSDGGSDDYTRADHFAFACRYQPRSVECHPLDHFFHHARRSVASTHAETSPDTLLQDVPLVTYRLAEEMDGKDRRDEEVRGVVANENLPVSVKKEGGESVLLHYNTTNNQHDYED